MRMHRIFKKNEKKTDTSCLLLDLIPRVGYPAICFGLKLEGGSEHARSRSALAEKRPFVNTPSCDLRLASCPFKACGGVSSLAESYKLVLKFEFFTL